MTGCYSKCQECRFVAYVLTRKNLFFVLLITFIATFVYFATLHRRASHIWNAIFADKDSRYGLQFKNYGFYPVNDKGVYSFWNVCVEANRVPLLKELNVFGTTIRYNESKKIVVYDSFYRDGDQKLYAAGSSNSYSREWDITFTRRHIPAGFTFYPTTAFFIVPTCPSNFHHFWIDEFVPLFSVIKQGNRLKEGSDNRLLYKQPIDLNKDFVRDCMNVSTYEALLKSIYVKFPHDSFFNFPDKTCFSSGVFGLTTASLESPREVVDHVIKTIIDQKYDANIKSNCSILFLDRSTRKILNIDRLLSIGNSQNSVPACKLTFEDLPIEQQLYAASHARVMVGVQGAGLQWAVFMPPSSHLVEIAWPQKHWDFYFHQYIRPYGIRHHRVVAQHVKPNWTTYANHVRGGVKVRREERLAILRGQVKNSFDHFWKWADVIVNEQDVAEILQSVAIDLI